MVRMPPCKSVALCLVGALPTLPTIF